MERIIIINRKNSKTLDLIYLIFMDMDLTVKKLDLKTNSKFYSRKVPNHSSINHI